MDKAFTLGQMEEDTKGHLETVTWMEKVFSLGQMEEDTKGNGKTAKDMDMVFRRGRMGVDTQGNGKKIRSMDKVCRLSMSKLFGIEIRMSNLCKQVSTLSNTAEIVENESSYKLNQ